MVAGSRNQKLLLFLSSTNTPVRGLRRPILLIGVYRGFGVHSCLKPTPFVRTDLLVQHRRRPLGIAHNEVKSCLREIGDELAEEKR